MIEAQRILADAGGKGRDGAFRRAKRVSLSGIGLALLVLLMTSCGNPYLGARPVTFQLAPRTAGPASVTSQALPTPRVEAILLDCNPVAGACDSITAAAIKFTGLDGEKAVRATGERCPAGELTDCTLTFTPESPSLTVWLSEGDYALEAQAYALESGLPTEYCQPSLPFAVGAGEENTVTITLEPCVYTGDFVYVDGNVSASGDGSHANPFKTITEALSVVAEGGTIWVAPGTYPESFTIAKEGVKVVGAVDDGDQPTVQGTIEIAANGVMLENVDVSITGDGLSHTDIVLVSDAQDVTLSGVDISFNLDPLDSEPRVVISGVRIKGVGNASGFTLTDSSIQGVAHGVIAEHESADAPLVLDGVEIDTVEFRNISWKGMYFEALSNASIASVVLFNVGNFGGHEVSGNYGLHGAGIDINLKYADYENISLQDVTVEQSGWSFGSGYKGYPHRSPADTWAICGCAPEPSPTGAAVTIKARDDGAYAANPATLDGLTILNMQIDGGAVGLRLGELNQVNDTPTNVEIRDTTISHTVTVGRDVLYAIMNHTSQDIDLRDRGNDIQESLDIYDRDDDSSLGRVLID